MKHIGYQMEEIGEAHLVIQAMKPPGHARIHLNHQAMVLHASYCSMRVITRTT